MAFAPGDRVELVATDDPYTPWGARRRPVVMLRVRIRG